jgi:hypothetical protein
LVIDEPTELEEGTEVEVVVRSVSPKGERPLAPAVLLTRLSGSLTSLEACGLASLDEPGWITLRIREAEAAQGGMATISMHVDVACPECASRDGRTACARCSGERRIRELFSAWLAFPPGVATGDVIAPSVELPGMIEPVRFRIQVLSDQR